MAPVPNPQWSEELELRVRRLIAPAPAALEQVRQQLQATQRWDLIYAIRSRDKSFRGVMKKIARKQVEKPGYQPEQITDIIGIRIVTLFKYDIVEVAAIIFDLVSHRDARSVFVKGIVEEIVIYHTTDADKSVLETAIKPLLSSHKYKTSTGKKVKLKTETSDTYSSVHIVIWCAQKYDGEQRRLPVEVQIRTVFEDAWGEVDHRLKYRIIRGHGENVNDPRLQSLINLLNSLKRHADGSSGSADVCREMLRELIRTRALMETPPHFTRATSFEQTRAYFEDLPQEIIGSIEEAYDVRDRANALLKLQPDQATILYREAVSRFQSIIDGNADYWHETDSEPAKFTLHTCYIEIVHGLLNICDVDAGAAKRALIYCKKVEQLFGAGKLFKFYAAVARYQHSLVLAKISEQEGGLGRAFDETIQEAEQAYKAMKECGYEEGMKPRYFVEIPKRIGYWYWMKGEAQESSARRWFVEAYNITNVALEAIEHIRALKHIEDGYSVEQEEAKTRNNCLYYALCALSAGGEEEGVITREMLREHLGWLKAFEAMGGRLGAGEVHTLGAASEWLVEYAEAKAYYERVVAEVEQLTKRTADQETALRLSQAGLDRLREIAPE